MSPMRKSAATTVEAYINEAPLPAQRMMKQLRNIIRDEDPAAEETISYRMPMYRHHGMLVGFAAFEHHVGFYAISNPLPTHAAELEGYVTGKGSIQFPLGIRLPVQVVRAIIRERIAENAAKQAAREAKKAAKQAARKPAKKAAARKA